MVLVNFLLEDAHGVRVHKRIEHLPLTVTGLGPVLGSERTLERWTGIGPGVISRRPDTTRALHGYS